MLYFAGERRQLEDGVGARDFQNEVCPAAFDQSCDRGFDAAHASADANIEDVVRERKGVDEPAFLEPQFAGAGLYVRSFADECDAIQAPETLADRHPSLTEAARAIHVNAQRVGADLGVRNECRADKECE